MRRREQDAGSADAADAAHAAGDAGADAAAATSPKGGQALAETQRDVDGDQRAGDRHRLERAIPLRVVGDRSVSADTRTGITEDIAQGNGSHVLHDHRHAEAELQALLARPRLWRLRCQRLVGHRKLRDRQQGVHHRPVHLRPADDRRDRGRSPRRILRRRPGVAGRTTTATGWTTSIPTCTSCTLEFEVTNFGRAEGAPVAEGLQVDLDGRRGDVR